MGVSAIRLRRAVFLDRDGVLNEAVVVNGKPHPPANVAQLRILTGAPAALAQLKAAGFLLICVTNQPDVARGTQSREMVAAINSLLMERLPLDDIFVCFHDTADGCDCRKPAPGLLTKAAAQHEVDLRASFMVGDRWRDISAGALAGCRTVLIDYGYNERWMGPQPRHKTATLEEAAAWILGETLRKETKDENE